MTDFTLNNTCCRHKAKGCCKQKNKLETFDWGADLPVDEHTSELVEVQFKNTRKEYFRNTEHIPLEKGDIVAVESNPGHDIGTVTLIGKLVLLQMKKIRYRTDIADLKKIYRIAKQNDLEKYQEAKAKEEPTMIKARQISADLNLNMKIGDVEYQGDGNKAIFYYIADERIDFRVLIRVLADAFKVRIEMKQIGARQEAGRIGAIGPCGRETCCSKWMSSFVSVSTNAARFQDLSLNPQKLAGQCAKLKCCMNFEVDTYFEAHKKMPRKEIVLETKDGSYFHFKSDMLKQEVIYSTDKSFAANIVTISSRRAFEIINMNKNGEKPDSLLAAQSQTTAQSDTKDILEQNSLTRFDNRSKQKKRRRTDDNTNNRQRRGEGKPTPNRSKQPEQERGKTSNNPQASTSQPEQNGNNPRRSRPPRRNSTQSSHKRVQTQSNVQKES